MKPYYITTTTPYVNAEPHIGFALEIVQADAMARFKKLLGYEVVFNTGTDEHGKKILEKANEEKKDPQAYTDEYAAKFERLKTSLNLAYTNFIRTTDPKHKAASQEFWKRCQQNGDIYKKNYRLKYCVGCELEKTDSELADGRCPLHPKKDIEIISEENYFFRFSRYQQALLEFYTDHPDFVVPRFRLEEIKTFVKGGLKDFSVSRLKSKMSWGVDVPGDKEQVMYVWFDALINYISTLGWPENETKFKKFWPGVQVAGKDNLRQQSAMWQAMLMSARLPPSRQIFIHGFITVEGQKMSKSLGNVISPLSLVKQYGTDAVRYYLLKEIPADEDGDFSQARMKELYNADLANELGNLLVRLTTLAEKDRLDINPLFENKIDQELTLAIDGYRFNEALGLIWQKIKILNKKTNAAAPWNKSPKERRKYLVDSLTEIGEIGTSLEPFLPDAAAKIHQAIAGKIKKMSPLFPRLT
ncbi:methionine--tRNA ligase [Candidatus Roizmanbacteria bacterium]|nr:methionine--tRNA ligase [Candidatus Roizmanbacteria bacterium]